MIDGDMQTFALTVDKILDHAAKWSPDTEVVTARKGQGNARIGYAGLRDRARKTSAVLAGFGLTFGERVATLAWNTQQHVEAWYAIMGMGAVCHTLNPRLTATQLAWMLGQSGARIVIVSADLLPLAFEMADQAPGVARILVIDGDAKPHARAKVEALEPLVQAARDDIGWGDFDERSPSGLCFTSGSTGAPKGVTYTHRANFLHTFKMMAADVLGARSVDVVLPVVPLFHASAWGLPFALPAAGAKMVLPGRHTDGASLAKLMVEENVTMAVGVPTVFLGLCDHLDATGMKLPALRRIIVGGAPMPPALMDRIENQLGVVVQTSWGMTELSPVGVFGVISQDRRAAVAGRPALGVDLMVADEHGKPLPEQRETEGRLHVRGAAVIERYLGQSQPAVNDSGWFDTGDLAKIERNGDLVITGRAKDLIKSGGEWINPAEIEAIVNSLPEVALSAVIGRADMKWSERPILLVELREGQDVSDEALLGALNGKVASWWIPDAVVRLPSMPLAATGKIDKIGLRAAYGQG
jgi:fatty-acyl-CoA synthase